MHVTKSPALRLCLGALLKKSFTRSCIPTLYISGKIFRRKFRTSNIWKKFSRIENGSDLMSGICQAAERYIPVPGGEGGTSTCLSNKSQIIHVNSLHSYYIYCLLSHNCIRIILLAHSTRQLCRFPLLFLLFSLVSASFPSSLNSYCIIKLYSFTYSRACKTYM